MPATATRGGASIDSAAEDDRGATTAEMGYKMMSSGTSPRMSSSASPDTSSPDTSSPDTSSPDTRPDSLDSLEVLRHDCAHVLAEAVQSLYPSAKLGFGPATEDGFYYDFEQAEPFTPDCFAALEEKMREIITRGARFEREEWERATAHKYFTERGEHLKAEHVLSLPEGEAITVYRQGDWLDLCRGPHGVGTGEVGSAFKLLSVSGTVWKGGAKKLQRLRGTCWHTDEELSAYLSRLERARQSDHRTARSGLVSLSGGGCGLCFLARGRLCDLPRLRALHPRASNEGGLPRGSHTAADRPQALGALWTLAKVPRAYVYDFGARRGGGRRQANICVETDELPWSCANFQAEFGKLPRATFAPVGVWSCA